MVFAAAEGAQVSGPAGLISMLMPFIIMLAVFYFVLWRPQQKQQKQRTEMLNAIKKGDRIVTVGGIHGEVTNAKGDEITVRIADKVEIRLSRSGVGHVK
ncbi:MAG: preprotein translocase subunit YajC [Firmicutes bacterium]|nr:preprotein translocase subunit YajC [Bacillota bacterium]